MLKSPVPKTGVSPAGPPRVEFPPPPPKKSDSFKALEFRAKVVYNVTAWHTYPNSVPESKVRRGA